MTRVGAAIILVVLLPVLAVIQLKETRKTEEKAVSQFSDYEPQWRRPKVR